MPASRYDEPSAEACRAVAAWSRWAGNITHHLAFWLKANCRVALNCSKLDPAYEAAHDLLGLLLRELPPKDEAIQFPWEMEEPVDPLYEGVLRCLPDDMRASTHALRGKIVRIEVCLRHIYYVDDVTYFRLHKKLPEPGYMIESVLQNNLTLEDVCLTYAFFEWIRARGEIIRSNSIALEVESTFF